MYSSMQLGKGFSRTNFISMRLCYLRYAKASALSDQLTWGHFVELIAIDNDLERNFYEQQTIKDKWTIRELKRQKGSALYLRLAASKDKSGILDLAIQHSLGTLPDPPLKREGVVYDYRFSFADYSPSSLKRGSVGVLLSLLNSYYKFI